MEDQRHFVVLLCVGLYMGICVLVGIWSLRRTKSTHDFFMAGRDLGILVTAMAVFSSTMSGFGFVGGPGLVYRMGLSSVWMIGCSSIGFALVYYLMGKRIRLLAELTNSISLPDVVANRYGNESSRFLVAVAILLGVIAYLASQIKAMAMVLQGILSQSAFLGSLSLEWCVAISCAVLVFYCVTGGIIASVYTDLFQGIVMIVASLLVFITAMTAVEGGFTEMTRTLSADDPETLSPWGTLGIFGCLSWYFLFVLGSSGQPHIVTKLMMNKRVSDVRYVMPITLLGLAFSGLLWVGIGLCMRTLVIKGVHPELSHADAAAPQFLQTYAHPLLSGIVFAGLFAAIMSTADGFLNIGTAAIIHDIPRAIKGRSLPHELVWARLVTVFLAIAAALFSLYSGVDLIALLGAFGWGTFAAALVPVVAIGLNWKRATPLAANAAITVSLVINFTLLVLKKGGFQLPYRIEGGAVALLVSLTVFFGISLLSKPKKIAPEIEAIMDF